MTDRQTRWVLVACAVMFCLSMAAATALGQWRPL